MFLTAVIVMTNTLVAQKILRTVLLYTEARLEMNVTGFWKLVNIFIHVVKIILEFHPSINAPMRTNYLLKKIILSVNTSRHLTDNSVHCT